MRYLAYAIVVVATIRCGPAPTYVDPGAIPSPGADAGSATRGLVETFAINALFLGETDRIGLVPALEDAWRDYGYDLDGKVTVATSSNTCVLFNGADTKTQIDGRYGTDNAWGEILLPILWANVKNPSSTATEAIREGGWTIQIAVDGLAPGATNIGGVSADVFIGGGYDQGTPAFDQTTDWPVIASSVKDHATIQSGARLHDDAAYVTGGVAVLHVDTPFVIPMTLLGWRLDLPLRRAVITFTRSANAPSQLTDGTIAGTLDTEAMATSALEFARSIGWNLCDTYFADQIRQAQDIRSDFTNPVAVACDAVSIGLGFTAVQIATPRKVVADPPNQPLPCVDAGTNDAADEASADASDAGID